MYNNNLLLTFALVAVILVSTYKAEAKSFEMFGIDILAATRKQITEALMKQGAKRKAGSDNTTDRYDGSHFFPGARMSVGFTIDGKFENISYRFDSGNLFTEVLKFDQLKLSLIEKYGKPTIPSANDRNPDFEEELLWKKDGVRIQLVCLKWYAAWTRHVTHRLCYYIIQGIEEAGENNFKALRFK